MIRPILSAFFLSIHATPDIATIIKREHRVTVNLLANIENLEKLVKKTDRELFSPPFQLTDANGDGFVTLEEILNEKAFDKSVLNFAFFQFMIGNQNDRQNVANKLSQHWEEFGFKQLDFNQFTLFWAATQMAKTNAWYFSFDLDKDGKMENDELDLAMNFKAEMVLNFSDKIEQFQGSDKVYDAMWSLVDRDGDLESGTRSELFNFQLMDTARIIKAVLAESIKTEL